ncbi:MAG: type II CAAX endopeptidase family protein [Bacillota bacterium]|nr:type II CAAX endopeptidase family protein [Bacillota bacterium]
METKNHNGNHLDHQVTGDATNEMSYKMENRGVDSETAGMMSETEHGGKWTGLCSGLIMVFVLSVLFLTAGAWVQSRDVNSGILITEFGLIMGGSLIYALLMRERITDFFRLKKAKFSVYVKVFFMSFFMMPIAAFLNGIMIFLIQKFGRFSAPEIPIPEEVSGLLGSLFIIAVSAGVCEEFMFRGALMSSFERRLGRRKAAFLAALFFGLFHFNLGNLLSPIALGLVFAYVTQVTGSIFPAMFGHFMNNANAVMLSFFIQRFTEPESILNEGDPMVQMAEITPSQIMVVFCIIIAILVVCVLAVKALLRSIRRSYPKRVADLYETEVEDKYDYPTPEYSLWKKQPGRIGVTAMGGILLYVAVYGYLSYLTFFS